MNRRNFIQSGAIAAAFHNFPYHLYAAGTKQASDRVKLGPMKVELSRLAMGTGTNGSGGSSNQTKKLGITGLADMYRAGFDMGLTFWDSADQYGSHPHLKEALKKTPREKVTIMTKTHASTEAEMRADLDRFRKEIGTDYLDIVLLHCMMDGDWNKKKRGAMNVLSEAREKGIIKTHGVSNHTMEALKTAAAEPWVQVNLARYNAAGIAMDDPNPAVVAAVLKDMKAKGKGVIGMKVLGAGRLRGKADEAIQYHMAQPFIDCFTIGAESREELQGLVSKIAAASTRG
jgi:1-deoxyxylulose-5-phosphate synthase